MEKALVKAIDGPTVFQDEGSIGHPVSAPGAASDLARRNQVGHAGVRLPNDAEGHGWLRSAASRVRRRQRPRPSQPGRSPTHGYGASKRYRCMVSGCQLVDLLEAAHIRPYRGENDNHPSNGLLLRADLHTLFDLDLLGIDPETLLVRLADPLPQLDDWHKRIFHVHGKDASIDHARLRRYGIGASRTGAGTAPPALATATGRRSSAACACWASPARSTSRAGTTRSTGATWKSPGRSMA